MEKLLDNLSSSGFDLSGSLSEAVDFDSLKAGADEINNIVASKEAEDKQSLQETLTTLQSVTADKAVMTDSFNALENLSFKDLIGKPMTAAIEAQAEAAKSTLDFVKQMCVTSADGSQQVAVVSFEFFKNGKKARINLPLLSLVNIPSLEIKSMTYKFTAKIDSHSSIIVTHGNSPVKSAATTSNPEEKKKKAAEPAAAETAARDTAATDTAATDTAAETARGDKKKPSSAAENGVSNASKETTIAASYTAQTGTSATKDSKYAVSTTMDIGITIEPNEIPGGIKTMLSILDGAIEIINPNGELTVTEPQVTLSKGYAVVGVSYRDPDGLISPSSIKCKGPEGQKEPIVMMNSEGANVIFSGPGLYTVTAGKLSQPVIVAAE
jgi:hypothetical protein